MRYHFSRLLFRIKKQTQKTRLHISILKIKIKFQFGNFKNIAEKSKYLKSKDQKSFIVK